MNKILYVAGWGRSGSTVLDVILGNHPDVVSVGEVTYLVDDWNASGRRCACGASYTDCSFWNGLAEVESLTEETAQMVRKVERRSATLPVLLDAISAKLKERYRRFQQDVFSYLAETTGASIVVDSSKSAGDAAMRFYALSQIAEFDVHVLHLVRDGRSTMASYVNKGSNWALEGHAEPLLLPGVRAVGGWTLANLWTLAVSKMYFRSDRYMRVQFEDLITHPARTLEATGAFIGIDVDMLIDRVRCGDHFDVGHNVGGNRIRHNQSIQLRHKSGAERQPWSNLNAFHSTFFAIFGQWLNSKLGYNW
ncbi:sulfotransferase [Salinibacter ruber]|uniref:sulfotransferase n=1 Tax=Salinibacter ruber TaxID=146919 RepID=UPI0021683349|nr:sulfotransferase [Salinibacter ruber]MCS4150739.1 hypothetical protein [Salinibacter ruber]